MDYSLDIIEHNKQAHIDIESDVKLKADGLFTFTLRVHDGKITDYNLMDYIDAKQKYLSLKRVVTEELAFTHYHHK